MHLIWLLNFLLAITLLVIHQTPPSRQAFFGNTCSNNTMFANNSAYQTNLKTLFRSLSSNATKNPSGYHQSTVINPTSEPIYGHYLCRGDQNTTSCHNCVTTATTTDLPNIYCPNRKVAIIWYDECFVRYSNISFFNKMDSSIIMMLSNTIQITGNVTRFMNILGNMMNNVIAIQAPLGGPLKKFAVGIANSSIFQTIYGLGQCTPDLTQSDCNECLTALTHNYQPVYGFRVMAASCVGRYEVYPFFNKSYLPGSSPSLPPAIETSLIRNRRGNGYKTWIIIAVVLSLMLSGTIVLGLSRRMLRKNLKQKEKGNNKIKLVDSLQLDFSTIQLATDDFSDAKRLGKDDATSTYKGVLPDGQEIAVKKLHKGSREIELEFENEILLSANLQHKSVVKLIGFCFDKDLRFLVYEFLPNGSLRDILNYPVKRANLDWETRFDIIRGLGRGVLYLHEDSQVRVIHRNLKPSNILLGAQMDAKISDFRTACLIQADQTRGNTRIVGTYGYMPVEYVQHGHSSIKSDVFSYGVILLEIITGEIISEFSDGEKEESLLTYVWRKWCEGTALDVVDEALPDVQRHVNQMERCIKMALVCVQDDPRHRPTMSIVVFMLNSDTVDIAEPLRPGPLILNDMDFPSDCHNIETDKSQETSLNDDSVSYLEPR